MKRLTAEQLQKLLAKRRDVLLTVNGKGAAYYEQLASRIDQLILRLLESQDQQITQAEAARLLGQIRKILSNGARAALSQADIDALEVLKLAYQHQAEYYAAAYGVGAVTQVRAARVAEAFLYYDRRIRSGEFLQGEYWRRRRLDWTQDFIDEQRKVLRAVQQRITEGLATGGTSTRDVAAALRGPLGELQIAGRLTPEQFATAFTRTQYGQLYNDFAASAATQAGVDKFVNIGVSDERQSQECYEASQQPPMTMAEWDRWRASNGKGGRPGTRHVLKCRCVAGAVPPGLEDEDWTQPNPKYEEQEVMV